MKRVIRLPYTPRLTLTAPPQDSAGFGLTMTQSKVGVAFNLVTTKPAGTGKIVVSREASPLTHIVAATEFDIATAAATLSISFADFVGIGDGSKYEIVVPAGWPEPLALLAGAAARDGGVTGAVIEGRVLKGNLND